MQYIKVLYDFCGLSADDEYSLHQEFSDSVTIHDIKNVETIHLKMMEIVMLSEILVLKYIHCASLKMYEIQELLKYELKASIFVPHKESKLRKPKKHDLTNVIETKLQVSTLKYVPIDDKQMQFSSVSWHMQGKQAQTN